MAYRITDDCISCGRCIGICANHSVYVTSEDEYAIDPLRCTECIDLPRRRCYMICPVCAIRLDPSRHETPQQLWQKQRALHKISMLEKS